MNDAINTCIMWVAIRTVKEGLATRSSPGGLLKITRLNSSQLHQFQSLQMKRIALISSKSLLTDLNSLFLVNRQYPPKA